MVESGREKFHTRVKFPKTNLVNKSGLWYYRLLQVMVFGRLFAVRFDRMQEGNTGWHRIFYPQGAGN